MKPSRNTTEVGSWKGDCLVSGWNLFSIIYTLHEIVNFVCCPDTLLLF